MGNFAENLNLGNRVRPPPRPIWWETIVYPLPGGRQLSTLCRANLMVVAMIIFESVQKTLEGLNR